ncbi:pilus assembly protein CpaC [Caulobacter sp. BK020]|nr:pilus assembly protein CpaC [Caulobacter sp. BK020]
MTALVPLAPFPFRPRRPMPRPIGPSFMNRKIVLLRGVAAAVALLAVAATVAIPPSAQAQPAALSASALRKVEVTVPVGKAQVLELPAPYVDLMISNPETADVLPLTRTSVYVVGKKLGSATLTAYGPGRQLVAAANVVISADVDSLRQRLHDTMPDEDGLVVGASNQSVVLSGPISSGAAAGRAAALAESFAPGQVVNMMSVQGTQQVTLSVRIVEMERSTAKALRLNVATADPTAPGYHNFEIGTGDTGVVSSVLDSFGLLKFPLRAGDVDLNVLFDALETKGVVKTLAEPNLTAMSGDTASFLAGGEFPVPVAQNQSGGLTTITVEFKQFGIGLAFTPTVLQDGMINLVVNPEVSSIDPNSSFVSNGLRIPGIKVRRAKTTVELRDAESFTIAGLIRDDYQNQVRQFPMLGDLPVLGALFRSTGYQRNQTELVIVVTPHLVKPTRGRTATPADAFTPPSDTELFLLGRGQANQGALSPEDRVLLTGAAGKGGVDGPYGHVLH